jgi:hypothetical protein
MYLNLGIYIAESVLSFIRLCLRSLKYSKIYRNRQVHNYKPGIQYQKNIFIRIDL